MVSYGFYNSIDGDRKYNASHLNTLFDGLIRDGVYENTLNKFRVSATNPTTLSVTVDTGKAWLANTWTINDTLMTFTLDPVENSSYKRIDLIVITVNKDGERENVIEVLKGEIAVNPIAPTFANNQFPIARILVKGANSAASRVITDADITNVVGISRDQGGTPLVTGAFQQASIASIVQKYDTAFNLWFDEMKGQITEDAAINLQNQINTLIQYGSDPCPASLGAGKVYFQYEREID